MTLHLNKEQSAALDVIKVFLLDDMQEAFILRGSAGTGKTTVIAALTQELEDMRLSAALLAPTGRAARILGSKVQQITRRNEYPGSTIHKAIYALAQVEVNEEAESVNDPGLRLVFPLKEGSEPVESLFVIDESSMIGDMTIKGDYIQFGSGRLLTDLVTFARLKRRGRTEDHRTKLLFVGDPAQLPPVGEKTSPALSEEYLRTTFSLRVGVAELKTVLRQAQGSAILDRATEIRDALDVGRFNAFSLKPDGQEIEKVDAQRAIEVIVQGIRARETNVAVVPSNATALEYNRAVREQLWENADHPIRPHDTLLVTRNSRLYPLSNGDLVKVRQVCSDSERIAVAVKGGHLVDLRFRHATIAFRTGDGAVIELACILLENLLDSPNRELTALEQRGLLVHFRTRNPHLHPKSAEFRRAILDDPYLNALQVKYGYAMTCHKAQGGEWHTVLVHFASGGSVRNALFFRWAYTAITRATRKLVVVNPPEFTTTSGIVWGNPPAAVGTAPAKAGQPDITNDPDWDRLSFSPSMAELMPVHQHLRAAWLSQKITIEKLQHLQYCERYTLVRDGRRAAVQYHYDGSSRVGRSGSVSGHSFDSQLAQDALAPFLTLDVKQGADPQEPFIREFLTRLDATIEASAIRRTAYKAMPYRLRVSFADASRRGEVDFIYDKAFNWTGAQEVGAPQSSRGLYGEIQRMMTAFAE